MTAPAQALLTAEDDFPAFRAAARSWLSRGVAPHDVQWRVAPPAGEAGDLFTALASGPETLPASTSLSAPLPSVPRAMLERFALASLHRDPGRFDLLYRVLWRLAREPGLRDDPLDPDLAQVHRLARSVSRDVHKMHAFVRFRPVHGESPGEDVIHVAWFEPDHHIVREAAPFFARRFTTLRWAILTPECSVRWDGETLHHGPGAEREDAPGPDDGEALWLAYYQNTFNPARLKIATMTREMPRRYWHNLPEAALIAPLTDAAAERTGAMLSAEAAAPRRARPWVRLQPEGALALGDPDLPAALRVPLPVGLGGLRTAANACRDCPIGEHATQVVFGEGPRDAGLMVVGEQPGDQEDLRGRAFVGPAGQLLAQAMKELGWSRERLYLTNAVKHFKFEPRGKRRMHKTPGQREVEACLPWLEREIALVSPRALVALGATAARALLGAPVPVQEVRGQWLARPDGLQVLVTLHPAALLRATDGQPGRGFDQWLEDLRQAEAFALA
ncbi:UdgX family uracil-DNA binding protein [Achromobacter sp. GG226]|uniref:UdgX family uracil-DNA binding protein n=1 Tax=Verticiella alkaliphila TaxID=2779529 RepID=UPI001C0D98B1|nr:UdgX family uracil-DNA binding protein [Verticiella sp. GG226]MBU4612843.1 UdgX family uracil-DNA binding protein [Verticiella sp. GG226]